MAAIAGYGGKAVWSTSGVVNELLGWTMDQSIGEVDSTVMSNGATEIWRSQELTIKAATLSVDVNMDPADSDGQEAMTLGARATFKLYPQGDGSGKKYWSGTFDVVGIGEAGTVDGKLTRKLSLKSYGAITRSTA